MRFRHTLALAIAACGSNFAFATTAPIIVTPTNTVVTFGTHVSDGAPFSVNVTCTALDPGALTLLAGTLPAGVSNVAITPGSSTDRPAVFNVSGLLNYSTNQTTIVIPLTLQTPTGLTGTGSLSLVVVPEPATLCGVATLGFLVLRRRAKQS